MGIQKMKMISSYVHLKNKKWGKASIKNNRRKKEMNKRERTKEKRMRKGQGEKCKMQKLGHSTGAFLAGQGHEIHQEQIQRGIRN